MFKTMTTSKRMELFPEVTDEQWNDWKWQVRNRIETLDELKKYVTSRLKRKRELRKHSRSLEWLLRPTTSR